MILATDVPVCPEAGRPLDKARFAAGTEALGYVLHRLAPAKRCQGPLNLRLFRCARLLQSALGQKPLVGIITGILPGTDGVQRMSKSTGNIIPINSGPKDLYGKVMSLPDSAMGTFMRLVTRWTPDEIKSFEAQIESGSTSE